MREGNPLLLLKTRLTLFIYIYWLCDYCQLVHDIVIVPVNSADIVGKQWH